MEVDKVKIRMSEKNTRNHTLNCLSKKKKKKNPIHTYFCI